MQILEERRKQKEHNFDRGDEVRVRAERNESKRVKNVQKEAERYLGKTRGEDR